MITLDEQIEWVETLRRPNGYMNLAAMVDATLATLRSVKQAEPVAWIKPNIRMGGHWSPHKRGVFTVPLYATPAPAPDGWVLVPKEPTPEMTQAIEDHFRKWQKITNCSDDDVKADCWSALVALRAALAAAPAAPQSPGREG